MEGDSLDAGLLGELAQVAQQVARVERRAATLPQLITALAAAIASEDPAAVDDGIAQLEATLGVDVAGIIDRLLDEEAERVTAELPLAQRTVGPDVRVRYA